MATGLSGQTSGTYSGGKVLSAADMAMIGDRTHDHIDANATVLPVSVFSRAMEVEQNSKPRIRF
ncbi:hypothetical protein IWQ51_006282 [Labrenzia sp. EL_142]|nr:hypothetical protein [Labrenzia sp. EL_142]